MTDVVDRHHVRVAAPPAITMAIARDMPLFQLPLVRAIIRGRELMLGAGAVARRPLSGLLAEVTSMGWGVLADVPDREVVVGAVTKPRGAGCCSASGRTRRSRSASSASSGGR